MLIFVHGSRHLMTVKVLMLISTHGFMHLLTASEVCASVCDNGQQSETDAVPSSKSMGEGE